MNQDKAILDYETRSACIIGDTEEWRPTHLPAYEVSDFGRVRSYYGRGAWNKTVVSEPRVLKPTTQKGYLSVSLYDGAGNKQSYRIHRLVAAAFLGPCPPGQEVRHLDHNRLNARLDNLAYGTRVQNMQDSVGEGGYHTAKLTADDVREIRRLYRYGWIQTNLAARFGVNQAQISAIVRREKWAHVP